MADSVAGLPGSDIGPYTVERELGRGGMAIVYLAADHKHERRVAIKVLDREVGRAIGPERFLQEIQIAARLTHPNILPVHDSGDADGLLYYVMPYVEGESLRDRLTRERHLALDETIRIIGNVAAGLTHAHVHGIIHRDIKPENILLTGDQAVVADFGIARAANATGSDRLTATGVMVGTPAYMSPEQIGDASALDGRSDIYSLACVAFEMLGGEPPFTGSTAQAVLARHAVDPVPRVRTLRPAVPAGVERAIEKALAKVPSDRYATADAFAQALSRANTVEAIAADRHPAPRIRPLRVAALGAAILLAAALWLRAGLADGRTIDRFAVLPFTSTTNAPGQEYFVEGMHDALISELARAGLGVIARTSVLHYRNTDKPAREIARELDVDAVIETSVTRTADSVRIETRMVDGRTEQAVWSETHAAALLQMSDLTRDAARAIARRIRASHAGDASPNDAQAIEPEVYDAYLKGRFYLHRTERGALETAQQYFELALARDPAYAPAHAGISSVWSVRRQRGVVPPGEATARANAAALMALQLDSTLAEPHQALAVTRTWGEWDWEAGQSAFREAIRLRPDYPEARAFYAHLLAILGYPREAQKQMKRARELDPLDPLLASLHAALLSMTGQRDDAIALHRETLQRTPNFPLAQWTLWQTLHVTGDYDAAFIEARKSSENRTPEVVAALDSGYRQGGYAAAMRAAAEALVARSRIEYVEPWNVALWFAAAGESQHAIEWLERAYQVRDPAMPYLGRHPMWRELRDDPRFQALLLRMNLPDGRR